MAVTEDTIVAVSTPPGRGAVGVVRVSGPLTRKILRRHFRSSTSILETPRRVCLGRFLDSEGKAVDRLLGTFFAGPASYTGEDLAELSAHGSPLLLSRIVETILAAGARPAEPGEFTLRAFLADKMDLAQAEAVRDLIESQTAFQAEVASQQLEGRLSQALQPVKEEWVRVMSHLETSLEFVEDEVEPEDREELLKVLEGLSRSLAAFQRGFHLGRALREGIAVAVCGRPNAGKSSLFNALLMEDRAIVTPVPGTTRDALVEDLSLEGVPVRLVDTAGIRESADLVERLGIERSVRSMREAEVVLFVVDGSADFGDEDRRIWEMLTDVPVVVAVNKLDLGLKARLPVEVRQGAGAVVEVSALECIGLEKLREALLRTVVPDSGVERESPLVTSLRHQDCIRRSLDHLRRATEAGRGGLSEEFVLYDLRRGLDALGEITGETTVEDLLGRIFSTFCIGK